MSCFVILFVRYINIEYAIIVALDCVNLKNNRVNDNAINKLIENVKSRGDYKVRLLPHFSIYLKHLLFEL